MAPYLVDAVEGIVYGSRGGPVGSHDSSGYIQIDGRSRGLGLLSAHRMIWETVNGPIPSGTEINHKNGVKDDNRIENLELVTHQQNIQHAYATGLKSNAGEKHPSARLTADAVREIRATYRRYSRDANAQALATKYGVGRRCIADVVTGHTWQEVV